MVVYYEGLMFGPYHITNIWRYDGKVWIVLMQEKEDPRGADREYFASLTFKSKQSSADMYPPRSGIFPSNVVEEGYTSRSIGKQTICMYERLSFLNGWNGSRRF